MAAVAKQKLDAGAGDSDFYKAKIESARFYIERILPRAEMHRQVLETPVDNLFGLSAEQFVRS
jgi:hypothetical protein